MKNSIELTVRHRVPLPNANAVRVGLDAHGTCWMVGRDIGELIGKRFPHIPPRLYGRLDNGQPMAQFEILRHWQTTGRQNAHTLVLGHQMLNDAFPDMCRRLYGPRTIERSAIDQLNVSVTGWEVPLKDLMHQLPGDRHVYASLVRQAFGAVQIQRDQGPFAPHHKLTGVYFEVGTRGELAGHVVVLPRGVPAILTLLGIGATE